MVKGKLMVRMLKLFHSPRIVATIEKGRFDPAFHAQKKERLTASGPDARRDNRKSLGPPCDPASQLQHI